MDSYSSSSSRFTGDCFDPGENRSSCDIDLSQVNTKTVQIILHVFQKSDGSENIPNTSAGNTYLYNLWSDVNTKFSNMQPMSSPTSSSHIPDTEVRVQALSTHFYQDDVLWGKGNYQSLANAIDLYNHVMAQNIPNKDNAIHILIPGNYPNPNDGIFYINGRASGIGDVSWSFLGNIYHNYVFGNFWDQSANLRHELSHNFGLYHTNGADYCDDTPVIPLGQYNYDNNVIANNVFASSITEDQVTRYHRSLQCNPHVVSSGIQTSNLIGSIATRNKNGLFLIGSLGLENETGVRNIEVNIFGPSNVTNINWTVLSGSATISNSGLNLAMSNLGYVELKAEWVDNCVDFCATYEFCRGTSYQLGPNPTYGNLTVNRQAGDCNAPQNSFTGSGSGGISRIEAYDTNMNPIGNHHFNEVNSANIDVFDAPQGTIYLKVYDTDGKVKVIRAIKM